MFNMGYFSRSYIINECCIILILILLFSACVNNKKIDLVKVHDGELILKGHFAPSLFTACIGVCKLDNNDFLYGYNKLNNAIIFYPLNCNKNTIEINIDTLRNYISLDKLYTKSFYVYNEKFFVISEDFDSLMYASINLRNGKLDEINFYKINNNLKVNNCGFIKFTPYQPILFFNNSLALPIECSAVDCKNDSCKLYPYALFSMNDDELIFKKFLDELPANYYKENYYTNETSAIQISNKNSVLISYCYNDSVDIFNNGEFKKRVLLKSKYSNAFKGINDLNDINEIKKSYLMDPKYHIIGYVPKYNIYYRTFIHEHSLKDSDRKIEQSPKWSIVFYDKDFNKIHELEFSSEIYEPALVVNIDDVFYLRNYSKNIEVENGINKNFVLEKYRLIVK